MDVVFDDEPWQAWQRIRRRRGQAWRTATRRLEQLSAMSTPADVDFLPVGPIRQHTDTLVFRVGNGLGLHVHAAHRESGWTWIVSRLGRDRR